MGAQIVPAVGDLLVAGRRQPVNYRVVRNEVQPGGAVWTQVESPSGSKIWGEIHETNPSSGVSLTTASGEVLHPYVDWIPQYGPRTRRPFRYTDVVDIRVEDRPDDF